MKAYVSTLLLCALVCSCGPEPKIVKVEPIEGDATHVLQSAIDQAARHKGPVEIRLQPGVYNVYAESSTPLHRHISNTTSESENPDHTKRVALWLNELSDVTISGEGATLLTHGELTPFAIENCDGITISGLTIDAADPTVPEMTVVSADERSITARVHPSSQYEIAADSTLHWVGHNWDFCHGIAQSYDAASGQTLRCATPIAPGSKAVEIEPGVVKISYPDAHQFHEGLTYQMRHSIRNQVCGLISLSQNVELKDMNFQFLGNFGVVSQNSSDVKVTNCRFAPAEDSGRTCAGFADFLQFSGCRGKIAVNGCYFSGAHDDAINVHGTHLRIVDNPEPNVLIARYMHDQTWVFDSFFHGDSIEIVDCRSLNGNYAGRVISSTEQNPYEWRLELDQDIPALDPNGEYAVENISATPAVEIRDCYFTLVPTRGVLITTRRPSVIENCTFDRIPMSAILVSDDARGWYESGPVRDLRIAGCQFIDCGSPVINIAPEVTVPASPVHSGISITDNTFRLRPGSLAVSARHASDLTILNNQILGPVPSPYSFTSCTSINCQ
ncbi:MAG: alpha-1,3-galactosidase [Bacteroidales bacterium]|nr:alpha-1,3-galactosidase [Bacteroidales bacterium]